MLVSEATWIGAVLARLPVAPLLNIGSSTSAFRTQEQPWVDARIFAPLRARDVPVTHVDLKADAGVDVVGDVSEPDVRARLGSHWGVVLCSNLLEHVVERESLCLAFEELVAPGGHLVVTVPRRFPLHADPIDTGFRPKVAELAALFGRSELVSGEEVVDRRFRWYEQHYRDLGTGGRRTLSSMVAHPRSQLREEVESWRKTSATCVVLRRT